jgi:Ni/Co efflux regulator RcnB
MKRFMAAAAALSLLAVTAAHAEDQHQNNGGGQPHGSNQGQPTGGGFHPGAGAPQGGTPHGGAPTGAGGHTGGHTGGPTGGHPGGQPVFGGQSNVQPPRTGPFPYVPQGRNDHPHQDNGGGIAGAIGAQISRHLGHDFGVPGYTSSRGDRPRYDSRYFPHQIHADRRFSWHGDHDWRNQPGYYYRRWTYGEFLPLGWFVSQFWIDDYFDYDLPVPPYGYEWVRSGPDALLVDTYTGEVVEAVYGIF